MDVHVAPGEPPRLTGVDDLQSFSVIAAGGRDALPTLAEGLDVGGISRGRARR